MSDHDDELHDDIDLSNDDDHAGDDWETLLRDTGADQLEEEGGGAAMIAFEPESDPDAMGYEDYLEMGFSTTSDIFGWNLSPKEISELKRAWGRVLNHYLPEAPTKKSPIADALATTGTVAAPRLLAPLLGKFIGADQGAEQVPEEGQTRKPKPGPKVVPIRPDNPNNWVSEEEREW